MNETTITKDQITTTTKDNTITISLDSKREQLPEPTTAKTALGEIIFSSLLCAFASALVTQTVYFCVPILSSERLLLAVVGCAVFGVGLQWSVSKRLQPTTIISASAVIAGVVLGS
ncbi:hypothetical protein [Nostoc sp. MS1]|uniref:hypothetical protein n=1 Tax=Nostoc sp. MS1 TaxID=2764711 RepID=UPI001CC64782|nr:hypothetical protein [Nostoc sp. MS1]BCL34586.1 hypothetical protein NSMS1_10330 [Nostoc sp. MS1]